MNMYQQLYDILSDAIFGDAVLNSYQDFVLTQISTIMAFGVTLIPVIALIALTVKLLKW